MPPRAYRNALAAVLLLLAAAACGETPREDQHTVRPPTVPDTQVRHGEPAALAVATPRGEALYAEHCAACHGEGGRGDGPAAYLLDPLPRDFVGGSFRLARAAGGVPTDEDLLQAIRDGMAGSAMVSFGFLDERDLLALAGWVRQLRRTGAREDLQALPQPLPEEVVAEIVEERTVPEHVFQPPPQPAEAALAAVDVEAVYREGCADCHGADGRGSAETERDLTDERGRLLLARDFTQGIFKGGASRESLFRRIRLGMPGSPMPAYGEDVYSDAQVWALVRKVLALAPEDPEAGSLRTARLRAARTPRVAADPAAAFWRDAEEKRLALTPLWWRNERIPHARLAAVHDGTSLAVRVSWEDSSVDEGWHATDAFSDGVALQWANGPEPPGIAMGGSGPGAAAVTVWFHSALFHADGDDFRDQGSRSPHAWVDLQQDLAEMEPGTRLPFAPTRIGQRDPVFLPGLHLGNFRSLPERPSVEVARAEGFGTLETLPLALQRVDSAAARQGASRTVVFLRALEGRDGEAPSFAPGATVPFALALFDGARGDRDGMKSITSWHLLTLDR